MSEYVDDMLAQYGYPDEFLRVDDYLSMTDDELRKETAHARNEKIKSIRKWPHPLSEKQRYCLAAWLADNDEKHFE